MEKVKIMKDGRPGPLLSNLKSVHKGKKDTLKLVIIG
jgi:hypothetical protein